MDLLEKSSQPTAQRNIAKVPVFLPGSHDKLAKMWPQQTAWGCWLFFLLPSLQRDGYQRFPWTMKKQTNKKGVKKKKKKQKSNVVGYHLLLLFSRLLQIPPAPALARWCPSPPNPCRGPRDPFSVRGTRNGGVASRGDVRGGSGGVMQALQGRPLGAAGSSSPPEGAASCPGWAGERGRAGALLSPAGRWRRLVGSGESPGVRCECWRGREEGKMKKK